MTEVSLISRKNLPDKARIALLDRAKEQGGTSITSVAYELVEDTGDEKIHKFSAEVVNPQ